MRNESHHSTIEPRSRLVTRRTQEAIRSSGLNVLKFAARVADNYMGSIAQADRAIDFYRAESSSIDALLHAERRNGEMIDRIIKGVTRLSADLEEAWVAALPDPWRAELIRELAARYGLIGARMPDRTPRQHVADLADVLRDAGEIAKAVAPMFANGKIATDDHVHIRAALVEIDKSLGDLTSLRAQLALDGSVVAIGKSAR